MQEVAHLPTFYAGRFIAGLAIGGTSMLAPQYLGENSPKSIRGSLTTSYNLCIILALRFAQLQSTYHNITTDLILIQLGFLDELRCILVAYIEQPAVEAGFGYPDNTRRLYVPDVMV